VPLVTQRADGTPIRPPWIAWRRAIGAVAERGLSAQTQPVPACSGEVRLAREELARLPFAAYVRRGSRAWWSTSERRRCWSITRARTAQAELLQHARRQPAAEGARLRPRRPRAYQVLLVAGVAAMLPLLVLGPVCHAGTHAAWAAVLGGGVWSISCCSTGRWRRRNTACRWSWC
jgi:hypothetical protein